MKIVFACVVVTMMLLVGCNKGTGENQQNKTEPTAKTLFAKWADGVYKEKELKTYAATISKAESVELLGEEEVIKTVNNKEVTTSVVRVKLADGMEVYAKKDLFAQKAIVFVDDNTTCFVRPTLDSDEFCKIPKGKLGFVVEEMETGWKKIYIGELMVNGQKKWVTQQWVNSGISTDVNLVKDAKKFEKAMSILAKDQENAKKMLTELSDGSSTLFSDLARNELNKLDAVYTQNDNEAVDNNGN